MTKKKNKGGRPRLDPDTVRARTRGIVFTEEADAVCEEGRRRMAVSRGSLLPSRSTYVRWAIKVADRLARRYPRLYKDPTLARFAKLAQPAKEKK